jgi:hypothetical protein
MNPSSNEAIPGQPAPEQAPDLTGSAEAAPAEVNKKAEASAVPEAAPKTGQTAAPAVPTIAMPAT